MITLRFCMLFCTCLAFITACKPAAPDVPPPPLPESADTKTAAAPHPVDATAVVDHTPATDVATADTKALAGKFGDGESVLELRADGSYLQTLQAGGSSITADGSWNAVGEKSLLLDPSSKAAEDARFDVISSDELRAADGTRTFRRITGQ